MAERSEQSAQSAVASLSSAPAAAFAAALRREHLLDGVRVLEWSDDVGAAYCGQLLAAQGAEVLRVIDPDQPAATRRESMAVDAEYSAFELSADRFKIRVVMAGDAAQRHARLHALLATVQVFVTDRAPEELRAAGLHWETLRAAHPGLVIAHLSVYGVSGPLAGWRGGDLEAQAFSGVAGQLGRAEGTPLSMPYRAGLLHGGLHAAAAIAAGLLNRRLTGHGIFIDISAAQALATDVRNYSLMMRYYDLPLKRSGRRPQGSLGRYPTAIFPCKDGYVVLTARSGEQYRNFLAMMGNPAWAEEARFKDAYLLAMKHADEADAHVIPWLMQHTRAELVALGLEHRFPVGPLAKLDEVVGDAQYAHRGFLAAVEIDGRTWVLPNNPVLVREVAPAEIAN